MTRSRRLALVLACSFALGVLGPGVASAQEERDVTIDFEVGDFTSVHGDWPITAVNVSGDLDVGELFVVELRAGDGSVLWAGEAVYQPPRTTVPVGSFIAVGDVEEAAIGQRLPATTSPGPANPGQPSAPLSPPAPPPPTVAGDVITVPDPDPEAAPSEDPSSPDGPSVSVPGIQSPAVGGDVVTRDDPGLVPQGNGFGGAGQLALSMVIAVVFVAILFRAPLPAATTTRWRK